MPDTNENIANDTANIPVEPVFSEVGTPQPPIEEAEIVNESNPEVPKVVDPQLVVETKEEVPASDPDIQMVRTDETGDKVYAIRAEKRYWVRNPETMAKMGFYLGREKKIPFSELLKNPEGEPIDLTVPNADFPWNMPEKPKVIETDKPFKIWQ